MSVQGIKNLAELIDEATNKDELRTIPLSIIDPDPDQPRTHFDEGRLNALADSIKAQGIIEPLIVSPHPDDPRRYLLAAGERRWRAAELAGLAEVPVVIREFSKGQRLAVQLVENIDREALSPTEESLAILRLTEKGIQSPHQLMMRAKGLCRTSSTT
ncbi:ParB/RepB/Spo0J family partition protein [Candidatus Thiosymbion oneisti]|uniref:ParB/RepB/Spo0J family partition protein n=1 Tax=Candidatus Thiosymbion oneisti TaxID=589554 RepID=UPI00105DFE20|nr:ParB/RepB/Spo0J family partition protein [Candidatus Thiosymbion oneisti]